MLWLLKKPVMHIQLKNSSEGDAEAKAAAIDDCSSPTCILVIGMAGSGKTTFTKQFFHHMLSRPSDRSANDGPDCAQKLPMMVNLDPAVLEVPYPTEIDITEVIDYRQVMQEYQLGPNGAIMTCLNLFTASQFEIVLTKINQKKLSNYKRNSLAKVKSSEDSGFVVFDTPGQIEIFTWSASGTIITETLAALYPTVVLYILDTTLCQNPATFMSNMLYACSILYKTRLPFILVFNKIDETEETCESGDGFEVVEGWLRDFESFQEALQEHGQKGNGESFHTSYVQSMSLVLEEFYKLLKVVPVSSITGEGFDDLEIALVAAREEYIHDYLPDVRNGASRNPEDDEGSLPSLQDIMSNIKITKAQD